MKVEELVQKLSYGELQNLALSGEGTGTITEEKLPSIIIYTNEGLLRLYSRFTLLEKDLIIEQVEGVTNYHLKKQFAESSGSDEPHLYIKDLPDEPFTEDVIRILEVNSSLGIRLALNDKDHPWSLFTPQPDVLQVPRPNHGVALGVGYQARHPELRFDDDDILQQEIMLPFFLEGALTSFIGYKVYSHMNGPENQAKSQEFMSTYEAICMEVSERDLVGETVHTSHHKLEMRGFR